ncbi:MAG: bifunctional folylpolyglutamate synthase/ dihydrofolate synthase, partial [Desulfovibrionaceae bacterium]|nr:bifunctional folylpolyglutamate synthase/ dihydrofolate synthase [Desulfovibrionaceae bacterium]
KGSTAAFLAALCREHGCRTGLYTSPHFVSMRERIRIDGQTTLQARSPNGNAPASSLMPQVSGCEESTAKLWTTQANRIMAVSRDLTYFEFLTVLSLLLFAECGVEVAVLEAGLGGRHDATTAVAADVLCFTPIAMDHADVLGKSLAAIAADKAAAVRSTAPVCSAAQFPAAARILRAACQKQGAPLLEAPPLIPKQTPGLGLGGRHQWGNAGLALCAWRQIAPLLHKSADDTDSQNRALAAAFMPGRMQYVPATDRHPALLLDGAHNPHGMKALTESLGDSGHTIGALVFSCLGDKDWPPVVSLLAKSLPGIPVFIPALNNPRAADATAVARFWNSLPTGPSARPVMDTAEALSQATALCPRQNDTVLVTGSLYLLAEVFTIFPHLLRIPS